MEKLKTSRSLIEIPIEEESRFDFYSRGIFGILGAFLFHLIIGATNRWNMLNLYVTSYYKIINNPHHITKENSFAAPLGMFLIGVGMRLGFRFAQSIGTTNLSIISVLFSTLSMFACTFMPNFLCNNSIIQLLYYFMQFCLVFRLASFLSNQ
jgi:hypothetical protein